LRDVTPPRLTLERRVQASDLQKHVREEQGDSLGLLIVVAGHGAFVTAFRNRAEIVVAHVNRQSPKSAALALAQHPNSLGRCRHVLSLRSEHVRALRSVTVQRFGGFVVKYRGDGVLVYFGYRRAREDNAERAVRAGLEFASSMR
jgi:hypothetical protein